MAEMISDMGTEARPTVAVGARADVIVVNWNAGAQLADCLRSVAAHDAGEIERVIVVDNGSTDGSADVTVPGIALEVIRAGQNLGFGRACNLAARTARAPFLLFLNPDAEVGEGTIAQALAAITAPGNARVGVVGIRLAGRDGVAHRHTARFPTWRSFIGNSLGLTRIARRWFPPILMLEFDHATSRDVEHVMGAFYLVRREVFEAVGGFDEDFFVYLEDLDLSRRIVKAGWTIRYEAGPVAYHAQGGTSDQVKAHRLWYALQSNIIYAFKHLPRAQAYGIAAVTLLIEPVSRMGRALFRRSATEFRFTVEGFAMLYRALPTILATVRRTIARDRGHG